MKDDFITKEQKYLEVFFQIYVRVKMEMIYSAIMKKKSVLLKDELHFHPSKLENYIILFEKHKRVLSSSQQLP